MKYQLLIFSNRASSIGTVHSPNVNVQISLSNYRSLETGSRADLATVLETFQQAPLFFGAEFPRCSHPHHLDCCNKHLKFAIKQREKCNFPSFKEIMTDRPKTDLDQPIGMRDHRRVTNLNNKCCIFAANESQTELGKHLKLEPRKTFHLEGKVSFTKS